MKSRIVDTPENAPVHHACHKYQRHDKRAHSTLTNNVMALFRKKTRFLAVLCVVFLYTFYRSVSRHSNVPHAHDVSKKALLESELKHNPNWKEEGFNFQTLKSIRLPLRSRLHEQLSAAFPYEPAKGFPNNIWQTWKVGLQEQAFPASYREFQETWELKNPQYRRFVITDNQCDSIVAKLFANVPDVAEAWTAMPRSILKADFYRYLILYARGGVYSDIDTLALKPIDTWVSHNKTLYNLPNNAGLVVGIEADPDRPDWAEWYSHRIQFCQWTIQAKKGHPMLRELIARITEITLERKRSNELQTVLEKDLGGDIMHWTGPGIFTDMVFQYMNSIMQAEDVLKTGADAKDHEEIVTWKMFTNMRVPLVLEDVLVLPITSFSPDVGHMGSGPLTDEWAYVQHMFLGTWKDDERKERESYA